MRAGRPSKYSGAAGTRSLPPSFNCGRAVYFSGNLMGSLMLLQRVESGFPLYTDEVEQHPASIRNHLACLRSPCPLQRRPAHQSPECHTTTPDRNQPCVHNPPLSRVPCKPVSVGFVIRHRSSLNGKFVTVRGKVVSAFLGDDACPPHSGICMQPSVFLANSRSSDKLQPQLRVLLTPDTPAHAYRRGAVVTVSGTVRATGTTAVLHLSE
jgi:hypothetical protein